MKSTDTDKVIRTTCCMDCGCRTTILAHVKDGELIKVEPARFPDSDFHYICGRGLATPKLVYHPDRLKYPLKRIGERGEGKWQRISWDEALDTIAHKFKEIQGNYGRESIAWATWAMGAQSALSHSYLRFANASESTFILMIGPGDSAGPCGDVTSYGNSKGQVITIDFDKPELAVLWGNNATVTEPWSWTRVRKDKEKGTKLVVIDPLFTPTVSKADEWISIRPGTDTALALAMMHEIIGKGLYDEPFIIQNTVAPLLVRSDNGMFLRARDIGNGKATDDFLLFDLKNKRAETPDVPGVTAAVRGSYTINGIECKPAFQLLVELVEQYTPEKASEITGASPDVIRRLAIEYATKKQVASYTGWGSQRTFHGDLSWRAITTLAAITGNISLRGVRDFMINRAAFTEVEGRAARRIPLLQMYEAILTGKPHTIKALWIAKHNFVNQGPNMNKVLKELLPRLEFIVTADMFMNASAQYSDIVLPVCTQFEFTDLIVAQPHCHDYMMLQKKVIEPLYESKSDLDLLTELAGRMGLGEFFQKDAEGYIEQLLSSDHPSMKGATLEKLKEGPIRLPEHSIPAFNTPSGRFEFYSEKLKQFGEELPVYIEPLESTRKSLAKKYPLTLLTTHSRFRAHTQFTNIPWLKELDPEPVVEMNPVDAEKRGILDGDIARVFNDRGSVKLRSLVHEGMMPGVVNIPQGWEPVSYIEGHHQTLTHDVINESQLSVFVPNPAYYDILVEVEKDKEN